MLKILFRGCCICFFIFSCKEDKGGSLHKVTKTSPAPKFTCAPQLTDMDWYKNDNVAPLFDGLGNLHYPINTSNEKAQQYFDQGLTLAYGFNHAEAARSFYYATKLEPKCAMAYWGFAYVLGPNYNAGMEDDNYIRAYEAIQKAKELSGRSSEKEKGLIAAMASRYEPNPPEDRRQLDVSYSEKLKALHNKYPEDAEIATLYGESMMNLHPWDLYDKNGNEKEWTPEIVGLLEKIIAKNPQHPGANHFYIHAVEASASPERGYKAAKLFDDGIVPNAGHLVHMPSHIYIRTGDYHKGTLSNINAVKADSAYTTLCHAQGAYPLAYYPHNYHFMAATAAFEGNKHWALVGAHKVSDLVYPDLMKEAGWGTLQHYYVIPYYSMIKFGMWDDILAKKEASDLAYPQAMFHYARGMAYVNTNNLENAKQELDTLKLYSSDESLNNISIWDINSVADLLDIADNVLDAEILAAEKKYDESIKLLRDAIRIEDALNYDEPPDWFFSVRHNLGDIQIRAKKYNAAILTYEEDLQKYPKNGWAQHGLKLVYQKLNRPDKVKDIDRLLSESWAFADVELNGSRIK